MGYPYGAPATHSARPARKRWPWVLLVVVVVLAAGFMVIDRIALRIAEDKAATTMQTSQHLQNKPAVSVAGFPFLTQLAAGTFDEVTIVASGVDVGAGRLHIAAVTVRLHHVTVPRDYSSVRADTATADARLDFTDLSRTLGVTVRSGGNGRLLADAGVTIAGQRFTGTVSAVVHASSDQGLSFADLQVSAGGVRLPDFVTRALSAGFDKVISLEGLPFGVQVQGVDVTSSGVVLHLYGRDLVYSRSAA